MTQKQKQIQNKESKTETISSHYLTSLQHNQPQRTPLWSLRFAFFLACAEAIDTPGVFNLK